jgi:flagellar biosynthesis chaperone FliJ
MAALRILRRLRDIRQAEEEQSHAAMESAIAELERLITGLEETRMRIRRARQLIASSAQTGEFVDRIAGLEEIRLADLMAKTVAEYIHSAENTAQQKKREFLDKRIERLQVETVNEAMQARDAAEVNHKSQIALDDWYSQQCRQTREAFTNADSDIPLIQ